jgi:hypothetical protein
MRDKLKELLWDAFTNILQKPVEKVILGIPSRRWKSDGLNMLIVAKRKNCRVHI